MGKHLPSTRLAESNYGSNSTNGTGTAKEPPRAHTIFPTFIDRVRRLLLPHVMEVCWRQSWNYDTPIQVSFPIWKTKIRGCECVAHTRHGTFQITES
ncbi:hypothetical protein RSAG8_08209, partial [Rhizoctonia solani AG-8 WAC10335]